VRLSLGLILLGFIVSVYDIVAIIHFPQQEYIKFSRELTVRVMRKELRRFFRRGVLSFEKKFIKYTLVLTKEDRRQLKILLQEYVIIIYKACQRYGLFQKIVKFVENSARDFKVIDPQENLEVILNSLDENDDYKKVKEAIFEDLEEQLKPINQQINNIFIFHEARYKPFDFIVTGGAMLFVVGVIMILKQCMF
jgi:uncharacterized protein YqgQ